MFYFGSCVWSRFSPLYDRGVKEVGGRLRKFSQNCLCPTLIRSGIYSRNSCREFTDAFGTNLIEQKRAVPSGS